MPKPDPNLKKSEICGKCNGSGTESYEYLETFRDGKGNEVGRTKTGQKTCSRCNGLGEY